MLKKIARAAVAAEPLEDRKLMSVVIGLQDKNALIAFDSASPGTILGTTKVTGLAKRETLVGIDFRPLDQRLYAIGSSSRLYTVDLSSGRATAIGSSTFAVPLNGDAFGFDFNPVADRGRVTSDANMNARIDPNDGTVVDVNIDVTGVQNDPDLAYDAADPNAGANPAIFASAYTNNDSDAGTGTTLFNIDAERNVLTRQGSADGVTVSPNAGVQFTVGSLGVDVLPIGGFDIETVGATNTAYASLSTNQRAASQLYTVNLDTGAATSVGQIGRARKPTLDVAVAPQGDAFYLVTTKNELLALNTGTPNLILSREKFSGFADRREKVVGIDFRPATGQLWALTDGGRLYTVDPATAVASAVGSPSAVSLSTRKTSYAFDFNPSVDRIRVTNTVGQNVRYDPNTGAAVDFDPASPAVDADTGLAYVPGDANAGATPRIAGSAYSNNVAAATPTTLYALDSTRDALVTQGSAGGTPTSPNTGQLFTVGATGVNVPEQAGFDIVTNTGADRGFAVFAAGGKGSTNLYSVNLGTGALSLVSTLGKQVKGVVGMAIRPSA